MKNNYFRTIQKSNGNGQTINIPRDISKILDLQVGDILIYIVSDSKVEIKKAKI